MATLQISNRTIKLLDVVGGHKNDRTYNLRSVSSVTTDHGLVPRPHEWKTIGYMFLGCLASLYIASMDEYRAFGAWALVFSGVCFTILVYRNSRPRDFWVLQLEVAGAYSRLLASRDKPSIENAYSQICAALEADAPFVSTVTIDNSTIVSESTIVSDSNIGGSVTNNKKS